MEKNKEKTSLQHKIGTVIGVILCIILIPILIVNCTLLFKGYTNSDKVPDFGGVFPMIVLTSSMYPEFDSGDLIVCKTAEAEDVQVGDVISFYDPDGSGTSVVTHRVKEITEDENGIAFLTKGDYNNSDDISPVPADSLIGKYTGFYIKGAGNVAMFMQTTQGLIVCVFLPLVLLVGYDVIRRRRYEKQHQNDKDELLAELEELRRMKAEAEAKK